MADAQIIALAIEYRDKEKEAVAFADQREAIGRDPSRSPFARMVALEQARTRLVAARDMAKATAGLTPLAEAKGDAETVQALALSADTNPSACAARVVGYDARVASVVTLQQQIGAGSGGPPGGGWRPGWDPTGRPPSEPEPEPGLTGVGLLEVLVIGAVGFGVAWALIGRKGR